MVSSPVSSQLSELSSEDFYHDGRAPSHDGDTIADESLAGAAMPPPSKRRKVASSSARRGNHLSGAGNGPESPSIPAIHMNGGNDMDDVSDVSSDTTGSVPGTPDTLAIALMGMEDEETLGAGQVRICGWEGCNAGDLGNQDELVKHVHEEHVNNAKQAKYTCEWEGCKARLKPQMSAYALRAHMRSHTKEKPFYCALPECDKSFTRSDALAKHMRTVHETESLHTSENYSQQMRDLPPPLLKTSHSPSPGPHDGNRDDTLAEGKAAPPRSLKLIFFNKSASSNGTPSRSLGTSPNAHSSVTAALEASGETPHAPTSPLSPTTRDSLFGALPASLNFTAEEAALPRQELYRLLRRQIHWAEEQHADLEQELVAAERSRREEWLAREVLLENIMEAEFAAADRRGIFAGRVEEDRMFGALGPATASTTAPTADNEAGAATAEADVLARAPTPQTRQAKAAEAKALLKILEDDVSASSRLPLHGRAVPWYRAPGYAEARAREKEMAEARALAEAETREAAAAAAADGEQEAKENGVRAEADEDDEVMDADADAAAEDDDEEDSVLGGVARANPARERERERERERVAAASDGGDTEVEEVD